MNILGLKILQFKNYVDQTIALKQGINCFVGENGAGKTNILDAIYYLAFTKSFLNYSDQQNIMHQSGYFMLEGLFKNEQDEYAIYASFSQKDGKIIKSNKKTYEKISEHIGLIPLVVISPNDNELIKEGSEIRRKFIDGIISQFDKNYLHNLLKYNKVLLQRNNLLKHFFRTKSFDKDLIQSLDFQFIETGNYIFEARKKLMNEWVSDLKNQYLKISGGKEEIEIVYESKLFDVPFNELLENNYQLDVDRNYTTGGIHKDDFVFKLDGYPIKKYGSQGQQKSYLIALKLAQFYYLKRKLNTTPILLLDDIFDKLDQIRMSSLLQLVNTADFSQIIITDTDADRMKLVFKKGKMKYALFLVEQGNVKELENE